MATTLTYQRQQQPDNWLYEIKQKGNSQTCYVMVQNVKVRFINLRRLTDYFRLSLNSINIRSIIEFCWICSLVRGNIRRSHDFLSVTTRRMFNFRLFKILTIDELWDFFSHVYVKGKLSLVDHESGIWNKIIHKPQNILTRSLHNPRNLSQKIDVFWFFSWAVKN